MHLDAWTFALQTVNAAVLVWLLARFLFRPVMDIVAARRTEAAKLLAEADAARDEAEGKPASKDKESAAAL